MSSQSYTNLSEHDSQVLIKRAISPHVAADRGYRTVSASQASEYGFTGAHALPGLLIPSLNAHQIISGHQLRPHDPPEGCGKYLWPTGYQMAVDVPPSLNDALQDITVPLVITESVLKADAIASAKTPTPIAVLGIGGVWGWRAGGRPIDDFDDIPLARTKRGKTQQRRRVEIAFDSDTATNPKVHEARRRFAEFLRRRGADVWLIDVPATADGEKQGIDDALSNGMTLDHLRGLARRAPEPSGLPSAEERPDELALRRQIREQEKTISALMHLIKSPYLPAKNKAVLASTFARGASQRSRGKVEPDGRVKLEARHIANDHRPKPEKGEELSEVNPLDGSRPIVARSAVIPILEDAQERGLLRMETRAVRRQHKNGTYYKDREILVDLPDTLHAFVAPIAGYAPPEVAKRKRYTFQEPCPSCGEVHSRTRQTICDGCGTIVDIRILPVPESQDPDAFVAGESTSTFFVEAEFDDDEGVSPDGPLNYLSTKNVEVDSPDASTKNVDPNESPPFAAPWLLDGFGDEAGNDRFTA